MFFFLSKALYFLIQPLNWIAGLLLFSLFSKNQKWKKRTKVAAVVLLLFFSNNFILNQMIRSWETDIVPVSALDQDYDIGIVLGGYSNLRKLPRDRFHFSDNANRLTQALELYKQGKVKKLLLTGGSGSLMQKMPSESREIVPFLLKMGVAENDLIIDPFARNTRENAVYTKKILEQDYPGASCLLITSAVHMRRSKACFKKENIQFTPYSTDVMSETSLSSPAKFIIPNPGGFRRWEALIKEWVGYAVYKVMGYV
jgi:uncharacterized SAM-binding protein YcdF (DUF218 family)